MKGREVIIIRRKSRYPRIANPNEPLFKSASLSKSSVADLKKRLEGEWKLEPVPWCKEGFFIEHKGEGDEKRRDIGNLTEHVFSFSFIGKTY